MGSKKERNIKVTGIRNKEIDAEKLAMIFWMQAQRKIREERERRAKGDNQTA